MLFFKSLIYLYCLILNTWFLSIIKFHLIGLLRKLYEKTRWPVVPIYGGFPVKLRWVITCLHWEENPLWIYAFRDFPVFQTFYANFCVICLKLSSNFITAFYFGIDSISLLQLMFLKLIKVSFSFLLRYFPFYMYL